METFFVHVRNELTGELRIVQVPAGHPVDAQVAALQLLFKSEGWRKATALLPDTVGLHSDAA